MIKDLHDPYNHSSLVFIRPSFGKNFFANFISKISQCEYFFEHFEYHMLFLGDLSEISMQQLVMIKPSFK